MVDPGVSVWHGRFRTHLILPSGTKRRLLRRLFPPRLILTVVPVLLIGAALVVGLSRGTQTATMASRPAATSFGPILDVSHGRPVGTATAAPAPATATAPSLPVAAAPAVPTSTVALADGGLSVAALIAEVEAAGIEPGSNWTWTMGDTATHCGVISGAGTGCTFGQSGHEYTVFTGSPTLALVAHELANAETQNDAVSALLNEVAATTNGTSWSPTDAVASCLVEHFMGFQDNAAGTWQCPAPLATFVVDNIHDTA